MVKYPLGIDTDIHIGKHQRKICFMEKTSLLLFRVTSNLDRNMNRLSALFLRGILHRGKNRSKICIAYKPHRIQNSY